MKNLTGKQFYFTEWNKKEYVITVTKHTPKIILYTSPKDETGKCLYYGAKEFKQMKTDNFLAFIKDNTLRPVS